MTKFNKVLLIIAIATTSLLTGCKDKGADLAAPVLLPSQKESMIGMTKEAVVAKLGKPALTQVYKLDGLTITYLEWHGKDSTTAMQLHGDKVAFEQILPIKKK